MTDSHIDISKFLGTSDIFDDDSISCIFFPELSHFFIQSQYSISKTCHFRPSATNVSPEIYAALTKFSEHIILTKVGQKKRKKLTRHRSGSRLMRSEVPVFLILNKSFNEVIRNLVNDSERYPFNLTRTLIYYSKCVDCLLIIDCLSCLCHH